jgi:hypothetical protein
MNVRLSQAKAKSTCFFIMKLSMQYTIITIFKITEDFMKPKQGGEGTIHFYILVTISNAVYYYDLTKKATPLS